MTWQKVFFVFLLLCNTPHFLIIQSKSDRKLYRFLFSLINKWEFFCMFSIEYCIFQASIYFCLFFGYGHATIQSNLQKTIEPLGLFVKKGNRLKNLFKYPKIGRLQKTKSSITYDAGNLTLFENLHWLEIILT